MYSHKRQNSRIQHMASLGWILQDDIKPNSPAHDLHKDLQYTHEAHKSPVLPADEKDKSRGRALSILDVKESK